MLGLNLALKYHGTNGSLLQKCVYTWNYSQRYENKGCPCLTDSIPLQDSLKVTRSHLAWDYVSTPGSMTFMKLLAKHGPSFEQGWVEYFFHVEPVWNSVVLATFLLEFHIQTSQSFKVKLRGKGKQKNPTEQEKNGLLKNGTASITFQTHFSHWILQLN